MRSLRTFTALALAALVALVGASSAAAAKKPKAAAFAAKYHLTGAWKTKDADKDGLKNFKEFRLGTNPKSADTDKDGLKDADEVVSGNDPTKRDSDGDGIKDGSEHAGVVTAFDGETVTVREFTTHKSVTATLDTDCTPADATADDSSAGDDGYIGVDEDDSAVSDDASAADDDGVDVNLVLGDNAAATSCQADDLKTGAVLSGAEYETDGGVVYLVDYETA